MEPLLIVAASAGLLASGFLLSEILAYRELKSLLLATERDWRDVLGKIQAVHNEQVGQVLTLTDRVGALEMMQLGARKQ